MGAGQSGEVVAGTSQEQVRNKSGGAAALLSVAPMSPNTGKSCSKKQNAHNIAVNYRAINIDI